VTAFQFGPFSLDSAKRLLLRDGVTQSLTPKAFDLLLFLVEQRERVVSKAELLEELWPDAIVEEANLSQQVFVLRRILNGNSAEAEYIATIPRRGYRFVAEVTQQLEEPAPVTQVAQQPLPLLTTRRGNHIRSAAAVAILAIASGMVLAFVLWEDTGLAVRLMPLASYPYDEGAPSLSPDGNMVAFACEAPGGAGPRDICVKDVGTENIRPVVETPAVGEANPAWSPDGREIAFVRSSGIYVISQLGGSERKVSNSGTHVGWTPDGKFVLVRDREADGPYGIYRIDLETLLKRRLTSPPLGIGDWTFGASPDGRTLAFVRSERPGIMDLYVIPMEGGEPRRLTNWNANISDVAWTADGRELIYAAVNRLWRIPARGSRNGRGTPGPDTSVPVNRFSMSRPGRDGTARLAFRTTHIEEVMRLVDMETPLLDGKIPLGPPIAASTRIDVPGSFSPDGTKIAFVSTRSSISGADVWIANPDGSGMRRITTLDAPELAIGSWSQDGRLIAFDAAIAGNTDIYVVPVQGGKPVRMTFEPSYDGRPEWSRDGKWIYFSSLATGPIPEVWKLPAEGGTPERVTHGGGFEPKSSVDGNYLYYLDRGPRLGGNSFNDTATLLRMPTSGGEPTLIYDRVPPFYWSISTKGVHFLTSENGSPRLYLDLYQFADEKVVRVGEFPFRVAASRFFVVSPDGRWALASERMRSDADLMLLENLR
jgi:Tol biopolymer transport system component/DNA-binding winged helix-turn-helix (wHTH) protein